MLSEKSRIEAWKQMIKGVLILIVLEDALWVKKQWGNEREFYVLILIVLEDALWAETQISNDKKPYVLILIVLEDALWEYVNEAKEKLLRGLNPYCIGRCSLRLDGKLYKFMRLQS